LIGSSQQLVFHKQALKPQGEIFSLLKLVSIFSSFVFKKPFPFEGAAFFSGFISVRRAVSGAPMNGSLTRSWCGRVSLISSIL
jgi:hypothetical protein